MVNHPFRSKRPAYDRIIDRSMVTASPDYRTFSADASDLGFPVGQWPGKIGTGMGDGLPFLLWSTSDAYAIYRQSNGVIVLRIFND